MTPLKITAHLKNGFSAAFDWSVSIDGIIAYQFMLEKLGIDVFSETHGVMSEQKPVVGLPLGVEVFGDDWWYQCSRPFFECRVSHTKRIHRRFNAHEAERYVSGKVTSIQTTKGPYKNARISIPHFVTKAVCWYVVGDEAEISRLLSRVTHIGSQRRSGIGAVDTWTVENHDSDHPARFQRAVPVCFAHAHNIHGVSLFWGIRPPSRHPENMKNCIMPENLCLVG